jgi:hypothetical protein
VNYHKYREINLNDIGKDISDSVTPILNEPMMLSVSLLLMYCSLMLSIPLSVALYISAQKYRLYFDALDEREIGR